MSALGVSLALLAATAVLGGLGWVIREYLRLSVEVGTEKAETKAEKARGDRILKEKESVEQIHKNRPISDLDSSSRL